MGKPQDDLLQRYFDGDLGPGERAAFEAAMSEDDRERLAALAEMRGLLAATLDAEAADVDLLSGVERKLALPANKKAALRGWRDRLRGRTVLGTSAGLLMAAAAAFLFMLAPWHAEHPTNNCDVEHLEVSGSTATVLTVNDVAHKGDSTTIIWTTEED